MPQADVVYDYLRQNYAENEPIFLKEIHIPDMNDATVRNQFTTLVKDDRIKRFDTGIYFFPVKSRYFRSGVTLPFDKVIQKKWLMDHSGQCGYISGMLFANRLGLTTQVSAVYEVYTNKATAAHRETWLSTRRVILYRPCVPVTGENAAILQFLDLLKEITDFLHYMVDLCNG